MDYNGDQSNRSFHWVTIRVMTDNQKGREENAWKYGARERRPRGHGARCGAWREAGSASRARDGAEEGRMMRYIVI